MTFTTHYSSSLGNLYEVRAANGRRLLIECGVPWSKLLKTLAHSLHEDVGEVVGCLVSHEHQDHCRAITKVCQAGIDVYASAGTFEDLGVARWRRTKIIADQVMKTIGPFEVLAFSVVHDAAEPLGFVIWERATDEYLLFATDTMLLKQDWTERDEDGKPLWPFSIIAIGCSFDQDVLEDRVKRGDINETLAKRLLFSHGSVQWVKDYLRKFCCLDKCREIHLLQMSGDNLDKQAVRAEIEKEFIVKTY